MGRGSINYRCLHTWPYNETPTPVPDLAIQYNGSPIPGHTMGVSIQSYLYLPLSTLVQIMPTIQIHKLSSNHDDPCTEFPGLELFKCTMPNPNGVSAERGWLVDGNSSARTLPIIPFNTVVALGTLLHYLLFGTERECCYIIQYLYYKL